MQPEYIDEYLTVAMVFSGGTAFMLIMFNALTYAASEGDDAPYVKQMLACLVAATVFVLSGIAKLVRLVL